LAPTPPTTTYTAEIEAWRAARVSRLTAEDGWPTVVGLFWLEDGENRIGSAKDNAIVLPAATPPRLGSIVVDKGRATLRPLEAGVGAGRDLTADGEAVSEPRVLASDAADATVAEGGKRPDHTYLCNMARLAGEESVSATLQGRPVDNEAMLRRIRVAVAANPLAVGRTAADAMDDAARMMKADNAARGDASRTAAMDAANQAREQELRSKPSVPVGNYSGAHR